MMTGRDSNGTEDLILCFSHLRWDFVFQRPQHLMTRWAAESPVVYWEEPIERPGAEAPRLELRRAGSKLRIATPVLPSGLSAGQQRTALRNLLDGLLASHSSVALRWYYTPMMLAFSDHVPAACVVYDCMDELSGFRFAPPDLKRLERELLAQADVVFTGGWSLYDAKRHQHPAVHAFPSSVDAAHFGTARTLTEDPPDQRELPRPRLGFYGVIDERMDLSLVAAVADARSDWTLVMMGPTAKIDPAQLPRRANIAWLGLKRYEDLPRYIATWDVALMPFAINEATRFISPTKTPEYLAAGLPVVSTPIADVVRQYGGLAAVRVASSAKDFVSACAAALRMRAGSDLAWRRQTDSLLADGSWDLMHARMRAHVASLAAQSPATREPARQQIGAAAAE